MKARVELLLVEDEPALATGLVYAFEREGYSVTHATDGQLAMQACDRKVFDVIVLDVMLPKASGFEVLKRLRAAKRPDPVILLTAKGQEADKLQGFDLGADDYVTKPFSLAELLARVKLRVRREAPRATERVATLRIGSRTVDFSKMVISCGPESEEITVKEADILRYMHSRSGEAVSRRDLLLNVWKHEHAPSTRTVDQTMLRLRKKLEPDPAQPAHLLTVHGLGYRLEP